MELLELAADHDGTHFGAAPHEGNDTKSSAISNLGTQVSLGRYDFLTEVHGFYAQHRKLMLRKGEALFHNYVGVVPGYPFPSFPPLPNPSPRFFRNATEFRSRNLPSTRNLL